ncbi:MAG: hypothetical protein M1840_002658 [Geoglossum simile]|nr:MAG: hypothetical protein M1840_002658 [Geoglossum simile]
MGSWKIVRDDGGRYVDGDGNETSADDTTYSEECHRRTAPRSYRNLQLAMTLRRRQTTTRCRFYWQGLPTLQRSRSHPTVRQTLGEATPNIKRDLSTGTVQQGLSANDSASCQRENESLVYKMSIVVQPPLEAQPNVKLFPPFTLRLRIRDKSTGEAIPAGEQLSRIWGIVSPVDKDNRNAFSSPSAFVSNGRLCDSPHPLHDGDISSFLTFQDVAFREPGKYRIRATLMKMEGDAALNWLQLESRPIHIRDGAESSVGCNKDDAYLQFLQERGIIDVPSPPVSPL